MLKRPKLSVLAGVSGVGKSYVISNLLSQNKSLIHFSAGELIKRRLSVINKDQLRELDQNEILRNQWLLVDQLEAELGKLGSDDHVLFDVHMIIDSDTGVVEIPFEIFEKISPGIFVFIADEPIKILEHRQKDKTRARPLRSMETIATHQKLSIKLADKYSKKLGVPLRLFKSSQLSEIMQFIST